MRYACSRTETAPQPLASVGGRGGRFPGRKRHSASWARRGGGQGFRRLPKPGGVGRGVVSVFATLAIRFTPGLPGLFADLVFLGALVDACHCRSGTLQRGRRATLTV